MVHNTFYVSNLKKCYTDELLAILLDEIHTDDKLYFVEEPVEIMDREVKRLKQSRIPIIEVRWNSRRGPEFTWKREDQFKKKNLHLFTNRASSFNMLGLRKVSVTSVISLDNSYSIWNLNKLFTHFIMSLDYLVFYNWYQEPWGD
nr:putative reverse transcriptase domain-containing protein [Tanacetum cinerariifolium]